MLSIHVRYIVLSMSVNRYVFVCVFQAAGASRHSTQDELPTVTPYERKKICTLCNVQVLALKDYLPLPSSVMVSN